MESRSFLIVLPTDIHPSIHSFNHSSIHSFNHSFIHPFIQSFIHPSIHFQMCGVGMYNLEEESLVGLRVG